MPTAHPGMLAFAAGIASLAVTLTPAPAQAADWTRPYIGGQIGYSWDHADISSTPPLAFADKSFGGVIGGVQAGKNFIQQGNVVAGIVADFNLLDASASTQASQTSSQLVDICNDGCFVLTTTTTQARVGIDVDWKASLRGKAGYLVTPDLLLFTTAGVAFAKLNVKGSATTTVTTTPPPPGPVTTGVAFSDSSVLTGFVVSGGAEMMITPSLGAFWQVSYYGFGSETLGVPGSKIKVDLDETVVQVGVNFYFN